MDIVGLYPRYSKGTDSEPKEPVQHEEDDERGDPCDDADEDRIEPPARIPPVDDGDPHDQGDDRSEKRNPRRDRPRDGTDQRGNHSVAVVVSVRYHAGADVDGEPPNEEGHEECN